MTEKLKTTVTTPEFRISYPKVFKPETNKLSGKLEYSIEALFSKTTDFKTMKEAAKNACINKWGTDEKKWPRNLKSPFRDQGEKERDGTLPEGLVKGATFIRFKCDGSKHKPVVVGPDRGEILEESKFYAGGFARASVAAFAYSQAGNNGVSFGLNMLQFVRDGEPFSGRPKVEDAFEPIAQVEDGAAQDASGLF